MLLGKITYTLGVVAHLFHIVKVFSMRQGRPSHLPHIKQQRIPPHFCHLLKTHLKWEEIFKIDRLKCPKSLTSNKKKQKSFPQK